MSHHLSSFCFDLAGSIFGMFEAYITKEMWHPNWNVEFIRNVSIDMSFK
jgi:hypothetical protein